MAALFYSRPVACASEVLAAGLPLDIYTVFNREVRGAWKCSNVRGVQRAAKLGAEVHWRAGGDGPLYRRLRERSLAMVREVATTGQGAGLIAFVGHDKSHGTLLTIREALKLGLPVVVFWLGEGKVTLPADKWQRSSWCGGCWVHRPDPLFCRRPLAPNVPLRAGSTAHPALT